MYFNSPIQEAGSRPSMPAISAANASSQVTILTSRESRPSEPTPLMQKKFWINENGELAERAFQNALYYDVTVVQVTGVRELGQLIERLSIDPRKIIIRGDLVGNRSKQVRKKSEQFSEPTSGKQWVMLDFDNQKLPEGVDPLSHRAIEYVIGKLPVEFRNVSYYYQFSNSSGVIRPDGTPRKAGFNGHVFFWLERPVHGTDLTAYFRMHCLQTGFFERGFTKAEQPRLILGIDTSLTNSAVQAHYISTPEIGPGVVCILPPDKRQGFVAKEVDQVTFPDLASDIKRTADHLYQQVFNAYKQSLGYERQVIQTKIGNAISTVTHYAKAGGNSTGGRRLQKVKLSSNGEYLTLYFEDESSPGSWFVVKQQAEFARHFGGDRMLLKELSQGAHEYVRDTLQWFSEVPSHRMSLTEQGYLPAIHTFAKARVSLVLAPTGSGKTKAAIDWCSQFEGMPELVVYAAPTIALIDQMLGELEASGLLAFRYTDLPSSRLPSSGIVVTTNKSLKRILVAANEAHQPFRLILDEIHMGLDEFLKTSATSKFFELALAKSTQTLLLTGTLTHVQLKEIPEVVGHALSGLTEAHFCRYEFLPVKRNSLNIRPTGRFDSDFVLLMRAVADKRKAGEEIPRIVILLDTSKLDAYRKILVKYELLDFAHVVSRQENTQEEIDAARVSTLPILIASPLFALGLNFVRVPELLMCRFCGIEVDTSQIIQAVNRGNRSEVLCQTIIYGNPQVGAEFCVPEKAKKRAEIGSILRMESSLTGLLEEHFHIDLVTYQVLRESERNSFVALSYLVEHDLIQNYVVTPEDELPPVDSKMAGEMRGQRKSSRAGYLNAISQQAALFSTYEAYLCFWRLEQLDREQQENWRNDEARVPLALTNERLGLIMVLCNLTDPADASKVKLIKVKRLFGEMVPWLSSQYDRETFAEWAKVAAEKTDKLVVLAEKLGQLKNGQITSKQLVSSLTRNRQLVDAWLALASKDAEYVALSGKFELHKKAREQARQSGSAEARNKVQERGLELLKELLESVGVRYPKKPGENGRDVIDLESPVVPSTWNLPAMANNLRRQAERLGALPIDQKVPMVSEEEFERLNSDVKPVPVNICKPCVFSHQNSCALGRTVAWQEYEWAGNLATKCQGFRKSKLPLNG